MADNFSADFSEVERLVVNMGRVSAQVVTAAAGVVAKGALNIKNDTRKTLSTNPRWKRLAHTVNFDQSGLSAVVGYDDVGQGELAGIYEFGTATRSPHPTLYPAAERELPKFEKAMAVAIVKAAEDQL